MRSDVPEETVLELAKGFIGGAQKAVKIERCRLLPRFLRDRLRHRFCNESWACRQKLLVGKYGDMINRLFSLSGLERDAYAETSHLLNEKVKAEALDETIDYRSFSKILWQAIAEQVPNQRRIQPLKPKFMLRQFVDEMPQGRSRCVLRRLAYGGDGPPVEQSEWRGLREQAFESLHRTVLRYRDDLLGMTGQVLDSDRLSAVQDPIALYQKWLFPKVNQPQ